MVFLRPESETGMSENHRDEAGRLAAVTHTEVSKYEDRPGGGGMMVTDVIALARLHADLAIADELRLIRQVLEGRR